MKEVLRRRYGWGLSLRKIVRGCSISPSGVGDYRQRAKAAQLTWTLAEDLDAAALEAGLFPSATNCQVRGAPLPDFPWIHEELPRHRHVTLSLLWQEYKKGHPEGYQWSRFCQLYRDWERKLDLVLRPEHRAGEKMCVHHAGPTVAVIDPDTGEIREASIFLVVLGSSSYT